MADTLIAEALLRSDLDRANPWIVWNVFLVPDSEKPPEGDKEKALYIDVTKTVPVPAVGWRYNVKLKTFSAGTIPVIVPPPKPISLRLTMSRGEFWQRFTQAELSAIDAAVADPKTVILRTTRIYWVLAQAETSCDVSPNGMAYLLVNTLVTAGLINANRVEDLLAGIPIT